jgi:hypothetical protein
MKVIIFTTIALFIGITSQCQALNSYADTSNYLINEIGAKKDFYIGKPFSVLFDNLKIKPVYIVNSYTDKDNDFGKQLSFEFNTQRDFSKSHFIIVNFASVPAYDTLFPILYPGVGVGHDHNVVINTYKPLIVKDIRIKDYSNDDPE